MKNNKKKVIAAILTVSMMASSVQMTSFAENGSFLDYMINKSETNLKQFQDNKTTLQKIRSWFSSGEEEKATQASINALKKLTFFEKISEMPWSKEQVISASQNAYTRSMAESKTGGIFNRLMSMFFGQSSFVTILFAMQAVGMVRQYYQNFKTKMEAGKIEKPIDPVATMQILDMLMENVKGQEKAKQQIRSMVLNIVDKNAQFMAVNRPWRKCYLYGGSFWSWEIIFCGYN